MGRAIMCQAVEIVDKGCLDIWILDLDVRIQLLSLLN
jgi:hypothetical protein